MTNKQIDVLAENLFEYGKLNQNLQPAHAIFALGNMDTRIAGRAADLWYSNLAPFVVASGGIGRLTPKQWTTSEAAIFAEELYKRRIPQDKVIVEDKSTNLPENIKLSIYALIKAGLPSSQLILVTLPFAERRIMALCRKQFPSIAIEVTSPDVGYREFFNDLIDKEETINLIVGEIDRLEKYPAKGFTVPVSIPEGILKAARALLEAGFDKYRV